MADPYIGEIRMFGGNFQPQGWAFCDGGLLAIAENDALFNLIGTTYGGDGQSTFGLPDLRGRVPLHMGTLPKGGTYVIGESAGVENVTLSVQQIPVHTHPLQGSKTTATTQLPGGNVPAQGTGQVYTSASSPIQMAVQSIGSTGGSQQHTNIQPYLAINFIISLYGIYPVQQ